MTRSTHCSYLDNSTIVLCGISWSLESDVVCLIELAFLHSVTIFCSLNFDVCFVFVFFFVSCDVSILMFLFHRSNLFQTIIAKVRGLFDQSSLTID